MIKLNQAFVLVLIAMPLMASASTTLTAADATTQNSIWAGIKSGSNQNGFVSELIHANLEVVSTKSHHAKKDKNIKLPSEIADREIIGIATNKNAVLVFTQWTMEQGDEPLIHVFSPANNTWKQIGKIPCNALFSLSVEGSKVDYQCEIEGKANKTGTFDLPKELAITGKRNLIPQNTEALKSLDSTLGASKPHCRLKPPKNKSK